MVDLKSSEQLREAIELFYFAYRAFTSRADRVLESRGLGRVHHRILYFVGRNPGLTVNTLLQTLGVSKQALNTPLRQLQEMELIGMQAAEHDRRCKQLRLTEQGQALEKQLTETQMQQLAVVFNAAGPVAAEAWFAVMREIPGKGAI